MSDDNVLSQDEIDALLGDMQDEDAVEEVVKASEKDDKKEGENPVIDNEEKSTMLNEKIIVEGDDSLECLDFEHQDRVIRGQFPVLERIHDRMLRNLADPLYLLFSRDIELEQEPFSIIKFGEFVATLETPLVINAYRFDPLRSKALMIFNNELIFEMVENYYGGHSTGDEILEEERELTQTEINTVEIACSRIIDNLEKSWKPIKPIKIEHIRTETSPQLLNIYTHDDLLIVTKFKFSFSNEKSAFYIVMPYLMVDPLREQLELGGSQSDQEFDPNWVNALKAELLNVNLEVSAELAQKKMKLSDIGEWEIGDFIPLDITDMVPMKIEGYPAFHAKAGTSNDKRSLQVVYKIRH